MKNILLFVLIVGVFAVAVKARLGFGLFQQNTPSTTNFGTRISNVDQLMARVSVRQPGRLAQMVTRTYSFTQSANPALIITAIDITEQRRNRGSTVSISQGGVGTPSVTLQFTSQRGAGIDSLVEIYGATAAAIANTTATPAPVTTVAAPTVAGRAATPAG